MRISNKYKLLLIIILTSIFYVTNIGCRERRFQKAIIKLDKKMLDQKRAWPYNYTFMEYLQKLDNSRLMLESYKDRAKEASDNDDARRVHIMNTNIERYEATIKQLKDDHKFYNVYKMRQDKIKIDIKAKERLKREQEIAEIKYKKEIIRDEKEAAKQAKILIREKELILIKRRKRMEAKINEIEKTKKGNLKIVKQKQKELTALYKTAEEFGNTDNPSFTEKMKIINNELEILNNNNESISKQLDSLNVDLDKFIEENFNKKDTVTENQMILSKEDIPTTTKPINFNDSIK